jgi:hypothetical protein
VLVPIILVAWLLVVVAAVLLGVAARRLDAEAAGLEPAPVIDLSAAKPRSHRPTAA